MGASNFSGNKILNGFLRGVAITLPTDLFVALHTAEPDATGSDEVTVGAWPAYVRISALDGGVIADAFTEAVGPGAHKVSTNANTIEFAAYDGASPLEIVGWSIWDAETAGNCIFTGLLVEDPLDVESDPAPKTLGVTDEFLIRPNKIGVKVE